MPGLDAREAWPPDSERLLIDYRQLAYGVAKAHQNRGLPLEDLRQEALLGLIYASRLFDPERGAKFSTYAIYWIKKQILHALGQESATSLRAEALEDGLLEQLAAPEEPSAENAELRLPAGLPELERRILILSCQNQLPLKEISQALDLPVERIKQLRGKALRRLKSAL